MNENEKIPPDVTRFTPIPSENTGAEPPAEAPLPPENTPTCDEKCDLPLSAHSDTETENTPIRDEKTALSDASAPEPAHQNPNRKRLILLISAICGVFLVLGVVLLVNFLLDRRAPDLEELRGRAEELITASREVNEIFFGEGLPSYPRIYLPDYTLDKYQTTYREKQYNRSYYTFVDHEGRSMLKYQYCLAHGVDEDGDEKPDHYEYPDLEHGGFLTVEEVNSYRYAERMTEAPAAFIYAGADEDGTPYWWVACPDYTEPFYYSTEDDLYYDYVTEECPYQSIDEIKQLAEGVYSAEYLASLYESMFVGITVSDRDTGTLYARYAEVEMEDGFLYLMKSNRIEAIDVKRVYDFSTMRMVKGSKATYVKLEIDTYLEGKENERLTVRVGLILENGVWMLDTPTY